MDSGLARFAVLIVLFFLLTGDLAGMVKHMFEEYGGKQHSNHRQPQQQRHRQQSPGKSAGEGVSRSAKPAPSAAAAGSLDDIVRGGGPKADGKEDDDPDMEAFGEQWVEQK